MLHNKSGKPLVLEPTPSRYLFYYLLFLHLLALGALLVPMTLSLDLRLLLLAGLLLSLWVLWRRGHWQREPEINKVIGKADGLWQLVSQADSETMRLRDDSYCSRWLVILRFQSHRGRKRQLVLLPDSLPVEEFRQLRVRLLQLRPAESRLTSGR